MAVHGPDIGNVEIVDKAIKASPALIPAIHIVGTPNQSLYKIAINKPTNSRNGGCFGQAIGYYKL